MTLKYVVVKGKKAFEEEKEVSNRKYLNKGYCLKKCLHFGADTKGAGVMFETATDFIQKR